MERAIMNSKKHDRNGMFAVYLNGKTKLFQKRSDADNFRERLMPQLKVGEKISIRAVTATEARKIRMQQLPPLSTKRI